jgi:sugar phosphate isomerase/epimerase
MRRRDYFKAMAAAGLAAAAPSAAWAAGKGRFRPAICAYSFRNQLKAGTMTYADIVRMAADVGADGIDLTTYWFADTNDDTLFQLKRLAYRSGVSIYHIGIRARMAQPTAELQAAEVETVRKWVDVAERLGASGVRIFGGAVPKGATEEQAIAWAVETLKRCAEVAGKKGITLGVEDDGGITTNAGPTIEIVKKAASPWAGINLDIGNFPDDGYAQIEMCAPYATNVHFKTAVHVNKQKTPADWPRVLKILGAAGYKGYLSLEYEEEEDPVHIVPQLIAKMRQTISATEGRG